MNQISVLIIARNEEDNIARAIKSAAGLGEVLVLDSGSTDNTTAIVKKTGARLVPTDWPGFPEQRRRAMKLAGNDWCLFLDADEELDDQLRASLSGFEPETGVSGYYLKRKNYFLGRPMKCRRWSIDWQLRLFSKSRATIADSLVHEGVSVKGMTRKMPQGRMKHNTAPTMSKYLEKFNLYTSLSAREKLRSGKNYSSVKLLSSPLVEFGKLYLVLGAVLDGWRGWLVSSLSALYKFTVLAKMREFQQAGNSLSDPIPTGDLSRQASGDAGTSSIEQFFNGFDVRTGEEATRTRQQGRRSSFCTMVIKPPLVFWDHYLIKSKFLKGTSGLVDSVITASFVFVTQVKLWELENPGSADQPKSKQG